MQAGPGLDRELVRLGRTWVREGRRRWLAVVGGRARLFRSKALLWLLALFRKDVCAVELPAILAPSGRAHYLFDAAIPFLLQRAQGAPGKDENPRVE